MDYNTASSKRGKYARVCVEIDLSNKPLIPGLQEKKYQVEYEYLPSFIICFKCGMVGHIANMCKENGLFRHTVFGRD